MQILIENAVKHNVISRRQPLRIEITRQDNQLSCCNPIQPKRQPEPSSGFGLAAIRRRYQLLGKEDIVVEERDGLFCVIIPIL